MHLGGASTCARIIDALCSFCCGLGWGFVGGYCYFRHDGPKLVQQHSGEIKRAVRYVAQENTGEIQRAARIKLAGYTTGDDITRQRRR